MRRRQFLASAGLLAASGAVAAPAVAQSAPELTWRLTSSFPPALDTLFDGARVFAEAVRDASDGRFNIEVHAPGEIVGALEGFDAVKNGRVECAQTALHYHWGVEPALVFATGVPFGMNAREQNAFFRQGGGGALVDELLADHHMIALAAGNTGCQMGGWFRNELRSGADLKGLRWRISGIAAKVLQSMGVQPVAVSRADIAGAFENNSLDAAAWVSPLDDEKLNLSRVAPNYYYPGWFQGNMAIHVVVNLDKWNSLPKAYQSILRAAAEQANAEMLARYDAQNPQALRRLVDAGAKLRAFPPDVMEAAWNAANDVYRELGANDAKFARARDAYMEFRNDQYLWWQVAEYPYDNFIIRERAKG